MSKYKVVKLPFPVSGIEDIKKQYLESKGSPGGMSVRYRMPKQMVQLVGSGDDMGDDETYGMGLGKAKQWMIKLQPRQLTGLNKAKTNGKSYDLVLTKAQLKSMHGSGWFSDLFAPIAKAIAPVAEALIKPLTGKPRGRGANIEICSSCCGSGLLSKEEELDRFEANRLRHGPGSERIQQAVDAARQPQTPEQIAAIKQAAEIQRKSRRYLGMPNIKVVQPKGTGKISKKKVQPNISL
jgi:hypothetical protein